MRTLAHSHPSGDEARGHDLREHLLATAGIAERIGNKWGGGKLAAALALLHDIGKASPEFQARVRGASEPVDHATAGGQIAISHYEPRLGALLAAPCIGHHTGLADGDDVAERLRKYVPDVGDWSGIVDLPAIEAPALSIRRGAAGLAVSHLMRMTLSALIDADRIDTARFYGSDPLAATPIASLLPPLMRTLAALGGRPGPINKIRQSILRDCILASETTPGTFSLTVPTGGGKTLASLAFGLNHAIEHGLDRVIYVAPYTSIIEQTAEVYRGALGRYGDAVLEHHSATNESKAPAEGLAKLRRAALDWDSPLVVTTAVMFFESLFSDSPSRCRRLHNVARSVIILDEAQTLPLHLLRPCVAMLDEMVRNYGSSVVICTATQPAIAETSDPRRSFTLGLRDVREIVSDPVALARDLRRVSIVDAGTLSDEQLAERMAAESSVLTIVNRRQHAIDLYRRIAHLEGARYLTTNQCAEHRSQMIAEIKARLKEGQPVRLVATSLIEAGVDVDFRAVYRSIAGLDQIAQAAGRCNREGVRDRDASLVSIFRPSERANTPAPMRVAVSVTESIMRDYADLLSPNAIEAYCRRLYWTREGATDGLDRATINGRPMSVISALNARVSDSLYPFETVAAAVRLIDDQHVTIYVPFDDRARAALAEMSVGERLSPILRRLQRYTVQVRQKTFDALASSGAVCRVIDGNDEHWRLVDTSCYSPHTGLDV